MLRSWLRHSGPAGLRARTAPLAESPRLLIVWHSRTGMARQMAEALYAGARSAACTMEVEHFDVDLRRARDAQADDLLSAQGFLFCAPENLATMSGEMKEFFDRTYYAALGRLNGRPYALAVAAGSDGQGAAGQMARICQGWRLKAMAEPLVLRNGAQSAADIAAAKTLDTEGVEKCRDLGALLAAQLLLDT
ncbi:unnamed protein product [Effrenium voratum]|nr:unnamed protein product [Effrenium voratum]